MITTYATTILTLLASVMGAPMAPQKAPQPVVAQPPVQVEEEKKEEPKIERVIVKGSVPSPVETPSSILALLPSTTDVVSYAFDINGDGKSEYLVYYTEAVSSTTRGAFRLYRFVGGQWIQDFEDTGTVGREGPVVVHIDRSNFFSLVDIDGDRMHEALITKWNSGPGTYLYQYLLKWNGRQVAPLSYPDWATVEKGAKHLLKDTEYVGPARFDGRLGFMYVCPKEKHCYTSSPKQEDITGVITFDVSFNRGRWNLQSFVRE